LHPNFQNSSSTASDSTLRLTKLTTSPVLIMSATFTPPPFHDEILQTGALFDSGYDEIARVHCIVAMQTELTLLSIKNPNRQLAGARRRSCPNLYPQVAGQVDQESIDGPPITVDDYACLVRCKRLRRWLRVCISLQLVDDAFSPPTQTRATIDDRVVINTGLSGGRTLAAFVPPQSQSRSITPTSLEGTFSLAQALQAFPTSRASSTNHQMINPFLDRISLFPVRTRRSSLSDVKRYTRHG